MNVRNFLTILQTDFYTGVPDSQLKALCNYLISAYGAVDAKHHIIAANEGNATAIAAGYHLTTGKVPVVYMQNSGEGNAINPIASLCNDYVYGIPIIFIIGWRGEPGVYDEPQHVYQGMITDKLLDVMNIEHYVITKETTENDIRLAMKTFKKQLSFGKQVAFLVKKEALTFDEQVKYKNYYSMTREEVIKHIVNVSGDDAVISTTGKTSRELFEIRTKNGQSHSTDFLTVGSMGHASSIALGVALNKPQKKVWCIDGDGALLMHMGAMPVIAKLAPNNLIHIVINNGAHESVGGQPTVMENIRISEIAKACGYRNAVTVNDFRQLDLAVDAARKRNELSLIEVITAIGSRNNLGRPTNKPYENKIEFMKFLEDNL